MMATDKKVILIIGEAASGKGEAAKYIAKKYNGSFYPSSIIIRQILELLKQTIDRKNYIEVSTAMRNIFGDDYLVKPLSEIIKSEENNLIIIDGVRKEQEILSFKNIFDTAVIFIDSSLECRYKRLKNRLEKADDGSKTFEEFKRDREKNTEKDIIKLKKYADFTIINESDILTLHKDIDKLNIL